MEQSYHTKWYNIGANITGCITALNNTSWKFRTSVTHILDQFVRLKFRYLGNGSYFIIYIVENIVLQLSIFPNLNQIFEQGKNSFFGCREFSHLKSEDVLQ